MNRHRRLEELERALPLVAGANRGREALSKAMRLVGERTADDFDILRAAPIEVAAHLLHSNEPREDALDYARNAAFGDGASAKLFQAILKAGGETV